MPKIRILTRGPNTKYGRTRVDMRGGRALTSPNRLAGLAKSPFGRKVI